MSLIGGFLPFHFGRVCPLSGRYALKPSELAM
jgi:hypothetical protein